MRTIAFVMQKGGTGKSTIASSLAVVAHQSGERVCVLDLDPQESLVAWREKRGRDDIPVEAVAAERLETRLESLAAQGITICILDTAGTGSPAAITAMRAADLNIIPVRPNAFDLWASAMTRKIVRGLGKEVAFLLNQCPPLQQSGRVQDGIRALEQEGALLVPPIVSRVDYQDATRRGAGVTEINRSGLAAAEIRRLWQSIEARLQAAGGEQIPPDRVPVTAGIDPSEEAGINWPRSLP